MANVSKKNKKLKTQKIVSRFGEEARDISASNTKKEMQTLPTGRITVFADHRERASNVAKILEKRDVLVKEMQLEVGDFVCSDRICIERKTVPDFLGSVMNQRIFDQLRRLSDSYERPVLILEGDPMQLYKERDMHENAIRGALSSIAIDYGIPVIWTENPMETAAMVHWIARREQSAEKRMPQIRVCRKTTELPKMQEFLVAGLPHINSKLSRRLLSHFRTPREVFSASEERLMEVEGMGREKVKRVFDLLNCGYERQDDEQDDDNVIVKQDDGAEGQEGDTNDRRKA